MVLCFYIDCEHLHTENANVFFLSSLTNLFSFARQNKGRCPDILSYPSDFPTSAYCASIFHNYSHAKQHYLMYLHYCKGMYRVGVGVDVNKTQSNR